MNAAGVKQLFRAVLCVAACLAVGTTVRAGEALNVPITVKEYPVTVVVPLERGRYTDPAKFCLVDAAALTGRHEKATIKLDGPMRSACRGIRLRHPRVSKPAPPLTGPVYVAVFSFDQIRNISAMSNVAELKLPSPR